MKKLARVLTTEQLAEAYECEPKQIQMNFSNNKDKFDERKHYFKLTGEELEGFKAKQTDPKFLGQFKHTPCLYLWTRRGASRHLRTITRHWPGDGMTRVGFRVADTKKPGS